MRAHKFAHKFALKVPCLALRLWILSGCLLLAACLPQRSSSQATPSPRLSLWGAVTLVAETEQSTGPALQVADGQPLLTWTGADEQEARHYARALPAAPQILALKAFFPFMQALHPASDERTHLLWLDRTANDTELQLLSAIISPQAVAEFGPNPISTLPTRRYSTLPLADNSVVAVWVGVDRHLPVLFVSVIDAQGRARVPIKLRNDADFPVLVRDFEGQIHLFWLEDSARRVYHALLSNQQEISNPRLLLNRTVVSTPDSIEDFAVAFDANHTYLFWQIRQGDGSHRVLYSAHPLDAIPFPPPQPLGIRASDSATITTGFNSGAVFAAGQDATQPVSWAVPLSGQHEILPAAVNMNAALGLVYFEDGSPVGYQSIVESGPLIGAPRLQTDRERNLYLTWAEPTTRGPAQLLLTSTRR